MRKILINLIKYKFKINNRMILYKKKMILQILKPKMLIKNLMIII